MNLLGAAALLLWGLRMVRTGVLRAYGGDLRRVLGRSMSNRFSALFSGLGIAMVLQSSTATALMAASFASRGLVHTAPALAIMLGADVGTTLVVQIFSFKLNWLSPLLILIGVIAFNTARSTRARDLGRTAVGLGLILLGLQLISATAEPMRQSEVLTMVLGALGDEPTIAILIAALLTVLSTSSLAIVLLIISLVAAGVVSLPLAFTLVLGANLGSAVTPLIATIGAEPEARRVPLGNLLFRLVGVVILLPVLSLVTPYLALVEPEPEPVRQVANFHTAFNLALAVLFIGLTGPVARLCTRIFPDRLLPEETARPRHLDPGALESPAVAIANAARETLRMGDIVEKMLRQSLDVFRNDDRKLLREVESRDDDIDGLHEAIKLYLTEVSRDAIDSRDSKRLIDVITFTTNLEHIGDIIDKSLMELAAKKIKNRLQFSDEGFREICDMHGRLIENLTLALNVFIAGDPKMARKLLEEKIVFRELERTASENHLARLRSGKKESIETSSLHLDVLRDLKRINSHLTSVAYPILDAAGELSRSRLK
ncbi:Na/Pi cotransporter family protein [Virgifigura deserti]|uniref:Na/Pi cotransporter family protein n=1 Tax=Virgifigura deserti TaxID=2268457 RepID=UPI003CCC2073